MILVEAPLIAVIYGGDRLFWTITKAPTPSEINEAVETGRALPIGYREVAPGSEGQELWVRGWTSMLLGWSGSPVQSYVGFSGDDTRVLMWFTDELPVMIEFEFCPS